MFLVELVMQGVRGFRELARLRFQGGFNLIAAGNESGKTTAAESLERLLFPSNQAGLLEAFVSRQAPEASRAALVMCSDDGTYYRIIQDFTKRAVNLSQYNPTSKDFGLLHKDWDNTVRFMDKMTAGISEEDYAGVFILQRERPASRPDIAASFSAAPPAAPGKTAGKSAADQERLAELRETLRKAEEAADADYQYQSAGLALEELGKKLTLLDESDREKSEIESTLDSLKGCAGLPENLAELIDDYERSRGRKTVDSEELDGRIEGLKAQFLSIPAVNLATDKLFIAGGTIGSLSLLAGVFVLTAEVAYLFPIGLLLSLLMMAGAWYKGSRKSEARRTVMKEVGKLEKERGELERHFQQESATITSLMQATGVATPAELREKADNFRHFQSLRAELEEQRRRIFGDQTSELLRREYDNRQREVVALEKAARERARDNIDTYSIRQDIERLETETAPDFGGGEQVLPADFGAPPAAQGGFLAELGIASRIGGIELETLVPAVEAAAQRNLATVTAGKYVWIEAGHEGGPIVHAKDDSVVNYAELSHGTRDLIYFCLRTGLVEALAGKRRLPFILDDPFAGFDPARQKAACQILRSLGTKTQVILFTSNPALKADGDAAAELA